MAQDLNSQLVQKKSIQAQKTRLSVPAFLLKTYEMIENKEYQDIVCWNSDGQSFVIKNINEFSERVLSNYFKHNNFASFVRQLNMYDFHKIRNENNETEFRHRLFQRGNKNMLIEIKRKSGDANTDDTAEQGQMSSIDMMEMERIKKDYNLFLSEVMNIKQKYTEQERIMHQMAASIERMYSEKQTLQLELQKFKEEQQQTNEKLFYLQSYLLMGTENIQGGYQQFGNDSALSSLSKKYQQQNNNISFNANTNMQNNNNNNINNNINNSNQNFNNNNNNNGNNNNNNNNNSMQNRNNSNNNNDNNNNNKIQSLLAQGNSFGQYGMNNMNNIGNNNNNINNNGINSNTINNSINNNTNNSNNINNNNNNNNSNQDNQYGQGKTNNLNSSFHSCENESVNSSSNNNIEHRISKKQDWASVSQLNKDGENIPVCPLPFVQKKKERNQICEKKIINLVNVFKNVDLKNIQKPDIFSNYIRDVLQSGKNTISEEAVNSYAMGTQAKRAFVGGQSNNQRQSLSMFENNTLKRICGNNNLNLPLGITDGTEKHDIGGNSGLLQSNLFQNQGSNKQISLQLQTNFSNSNNGGNSGTTGLFSPSYFNGGEVSPRLPFNVYPSPTHNNGNQNNFGNNFSGNHHSGLQNFLTSPSPNMSPLLLRDMEEFITQQNVNQSLAFGIGSQGANVGVSNGSNNIENNRRLANDLLTSLKSEAKQENKFY